MSDALIVWLVCLCFGAERGQTSAIIVAQHTCVIASDIGATRVIDDRTRWTLCVHNDVACGLRNIEWLLANCWRWREKVRRRV